MSDPLWPLCARACETGCANTVEETGACCGGYYRCLMENATHQRTCHCCYRDVFVPLRMGEPEGAACAKCKCYICVDCAPRIVCNGFHEPLPGSVCGEPVCFGCRRGGPCENGVNLTYYGLYPLHDATVALRRALRVITAYKPVHPWDVAACVTEIAHEAFAETEAGVRVGAAVKGVGEETLRDAAREIGVSDLVALSKVVEGRLRRRAKGLCIPPDRCGDVADICAQIVIASVRSIAWSQDDVPFDKGEAAALQTLRDFIGDQDREIPCISLARRLGRLK